MISFKEFLDEDWKSSWKKAGKDPKVVRTGLKATDAAVRTVKTIGAGAMGGALLGTPGGIDTMKITVPAMAGLGALSATVTGAAPSAVYHAGKYVLQRGAKTAVNRIKEVSNERRQRKPKTA